MELKVFLYMAVLVFTATEVIKGVVNVYIPKVKIGLLLALVLGILFDLGLGIGLVSFLGEIEYNSTMIPVLFQGVDILTTGAILSMGSKGLNVVLEKMGIDIAGSISSKIKIEDSDK